MIKTSKKLAFLYTILFVCNHLPPYRNFHSKSRSYHCQKFIFYWKNPLDFTVNIIFNYFLWEIKSFWFLLKAWLLIIIIDNVVSIFKYFLQEIESFWFLEKDWPLINIFLSYIIYFVTTIFIIIFTYSKEEIKRFWLKMMVTYFLINIINQCCFISIDSIQKCNFQNFDYFNYNYLVIVAMIMVFY